MKRILCGVLLWFLVFSGRSTPLSDGAENIDRKYFDDYFPSIFLSTESGNIHIVSDDTLFVEIVKTIRNINPDSALVLLDYAEIEFDTSEGKLSYSFSGTSEGFPEDVSCQVSFICHVLPSTEIHAFSGSGNIDIHEIFSKVFCNVENGNINMAGGNGTVELKLGKGNINLRWSMRNTDALLIESGQGNITVLLPLSLCADLSVKLAQGNFTISGFEQILQNSSTEQGLYTFTLRDGGTKVDITNNQGNITILGY
ncbi:DUF4097 family beta strand repeat protein [candidate division WOR-3 bacterium]|nr:DUF4097 family beta strand repeat protein [candidate division WOR-3 bacterium]